MSPGSRGLKGARRVRFRCVRADRTALEYCPHRRSGLRKICSWEHSGLVGDRSTVLTSVVNRSIWDSLGTLPLLRKSLLEATGAGGGGDLFQGSTNQAGCRFHGGEKLPTRNAAPSALLEELSFLGRETRM